MRLCLGGACIVGAITVLLVSYGAHAAVFQVVISRVVLGANVKKRKVRRFWLGLLSFYISPVRVWEVVWGCFLNSMWGEVAHTCRVFCHRTSRFIIRTMTNLEYGFLGVNHLLLKGRKWQRIG